MPGLECLVPNVRVHYSTTLQRKAEKAEKRGDSVDVILAEAGLSLMDRQQKAVCYPTQGQSLGAMWELADTINMPEITIAFRACKK